MCFMDELLFLILLNTIDFCFIPFHFFLNLKWLYIDFACYLVSSTILCWFFYVIFVAYLSVVYPNHQGVSLFSVLLHFFLPFFSFINVL